MHHRDRRRFGGISIAASAVTLLAGPALAEEVIVQNDSFQSGGPAVIVGGFTPGEHGGARLTAPCNGTIVGVQIAWLAEDPDAAPIIEEAIHIFEGDSFPVPGDELATLIGPLMTPGFFNEFRYLDQEQEVPINIPVQAGDQFYVTLEFAESSFPLTGSVIRDLDGCQSGRNVLFAPSSGGWLNFCGAPFFLQGDLVIRAIIDCATGAGACCFTNGTCAFLTEDACMNAQGDFQGAGTLCGDVQCASTFQACCFDSGGCLDLEPENCLGAGGAPQGPGTNCDAEDCVLAGACCFDTPFCLELTEPDCLKAGAAWAGPGTTCEDADENGVADDCESAACPQDLDGSGAVDFGDILAILTAWGPCTDCPEDLDGSGAADFGDILVVLTGWGLCE